VVSPARLAFTAIYLLLWPVVLVAIGGDWRWPAGWAFGAWFVVMSLHVILWLRRHDPALLEERYRRPGSGGQSAHDRRLVYVLFPAFLGWFVMMPLDRRFGWTAPLARAITVAAAVAGGALLLGAWFFLFRAFKDNSFASPLVRIQRERGQHVVSTGVYAVVRHPMYLGATLMFVGAPLLTGAATALLAMLALVAILAVRIGDEEALLVKELEGYAEYRRRVRWRLVPYLW
jgi:protein-S-isoprenylcysteine O-methyltransferase Ste14